jgi:hypothetical protein
LITSSNKCVEGVPGFAIVFARLATMAKDGNHASSVSLDIIKQQFVFFFSFPLSFFGRSHGFLFCIV